MNYILTVILLLSVVGLSGCNEAPSPKTDRVECVEVELCDGNPVQAFSGLAIVTEPVEQLSQIESE
jgi:hypothetical protein